MTAQAREAPQPPLGIIEVISRGFEAVTNRLELILAPVLLDLLLWLGPRLSIQRLMTDLLGNLSLPPGTDAETLQSLDHLQQVIAEVAARYNLFSILNTFPLGVPSLMAGRLPETSPLGLRPLIEISDPLGYLSLVMGLFLAGLLLGAVYLELVAQQAWTGQWDWGRLAGRLLPGWGRFLILSLFVGPLILGVQALVLLTGQAGILSLIGLTLALWVVTYLVFSLHGIVAGQGVFRSVLDSLRLVRLNLPGTLTLFTLLLVLNWGLGMVWNIPDDDSWQMLIGVGGHAYVVTALMASTFIFYRDRSRWVTEMRAHAAALAGGSRRQVK